MLMSFARDDTTAAISIAFSMTNTLLANDSQSRARFGTRWIYTLDSLVTGSPNGGGDAGSMVTKRQQGCYRW